MASAIGELILRKFVMSSGALASGQGLNLNKVLTAGVKNDGRMVNARRRGMAQRAAEWRAGNFDATFSLCQLPQEIVRMKGLQTWRKPQPAAEALLP